MSDTMKAAVYTKFGPPEVLQVKEVPKPAPKAGEVLIRIRATTVEKEDPDARARPGLNGIFKVKNPILGLLLAGDVEALGTGVTKFKVGDHVYGSTTLSYGATAQYICLPEDGALVTRPENITENGAVAILNGVITALPYLREKGKIHAGQKVLINGASGSVGSAAVQLAKSFDTEVTGVCSTRNLELVTSIGADRVIDYTREDFTQSDAKYDLIFDTVGKSSYKRCKPILKPGGLYLTTMPTLSILFHPKKVKFTATGLRKAPKKRKDLLVLNQLIEEGKILPVIDREYPLEQIADAHVLVATGHKRGSVVITID